jgi:hypothetical protein
MKEDRRQELHASSEAELARAGELTPTPRDEAEDEEIGREADDATADSGERGDTGSRLAEWREAERAIDDTDPSTVEGEELRDDASKAHDAYTLAERAQRQRHGEPKRPA